MTKSTVKLSVIALDYDGTTAQNDAMVPLVREAIAAARRRGIAVLLVTGRILADLRRVAGDLTFVDGVVAENGAVLHFPQTGHTTLLAPGVIAGFVDELRRRNLPNWPGQCLVDAHATDAVAFLDVIRQLELPLVLIFNGGRVMALAQGISKATGLQEMLETLRKSAHNMLAIGDAENDHELLRLAEVGAAVEWGSTALRAVADTVVPGLGPPAVAVYLDDLTRDGRLPSPPRARRRLRLGYTDDEREFSLAAKGRNVLIAGDAMSGKSWVAGLLCEQLILHGYCVCVIDPEGDYGSLEALPGVTVLGHDDAPLTPRDLLRALRYPDRSVVVDLSKRSQEEKLHYIQTALPLLNELRRQTGFPHRILVDEAHYFLQDPGARHLLDLETNAYTFVTYRASVLPHELLEATDVVIVTRESDPGEIDSLRRWCRKCGQVDSARWTSLGHLATAQAVALPVTEEAGGDLVQFTLAPRLATHVRHRDKYVDVPVSETAAFVFTGSRPQERRVARTLRQFVAELKARRDFDDYLRRGDFSRWVDGVFGDQALAAELRELEASHRAAPSVDTVPAVIQAIAERYNVA